MGKQLNKKICKSSKERRRQAQEKRINRLEKKILEIGYENLEEYSIDEVYADKWLTEERLLELGEIRQQEKPIGKVLWDDETLSFQVTERLSAELCEVIEVYNEILEYERILYCDE